MEEPYAGTDAAKLREAAAANGIFLNDYTLEVDLFKCGRHKSICKTLLELSANDAAKARAQGWMDRPETLDASRLLKDILPIGKGRFAQRLATNMKSGPCPKYIKDALEYVATSCR
jgi:putative ATP-dependent endonuclease of OLD family